MANPTPNTTPPPNPDIHKHRPAPNSATNTTARKHARQVVKTLEADLRAAQVAYMNSLVNMLDCLNTALDRAMQALELDAVRVLPADLKAEWEARLEWWEELRVWRVQLAEEFLALREEIGGVLVGVSDCLDGRGWGWKRSLELSMR